MLNNISLNPTTLAVKMTDNNIIPLLKLPIMVQKIKDFKAYNKLKSQNVGEAINNWSCGEANRCFTMMKVNISQLKNREYDWYAQKVPYNFLRNIIILDHDLNKEDKWSQIIFTIPSAMSVLHSNLTNLWDESNVRIIVMFIFLQILLLTVLFQPIKNYIVNVCIMLEHLPVIFTSGRTSGNLELLPPVRKFSSKSRNHQKSDCCCKIKEGRRRAKRSLRLSSLVLTVVG